MRRRPAAERSADDRARQSPPVLKEHVEETVLRAFDLPQWDFLGR
jgi:hypothetical protein